MAELCESSGPLHVAVDGESARAPGKGTFSGCPHLVSAWAVENRLVLGRRSVPAGGHEIAAVPDLLAAPDLEGAVVTLGGAGCQKATVAQVRERGRGYVVRVKGDREGLRDAVAGVLDRAGEAEFAGCDMASGAGEAHGRAGGRCGTVVRNPEGLPEGWADVGAVAPVCRGRQAKGQKNTSAGRYDIPSRRAAAPGLAGHIRNHRGIESGLHRALGVSFREGDGRTRAGHAAANLGMLRRVAVSLLKRTETKGSIQTRREKAGWDGDYLLQVRQGITAKDSA
jgi:predicted transposase YbfD/YdcC